MNSSNHIAKTGPLQPKLTFRLSPLWQCQGQPGGMTRLSTVHRGDSQMAMMGDLAAIGDRQRAEHHGRIVTLRGRAATMWVPA